MKKIRALLLILFALGALSFWVFKPAVVSSSLAKVESSHSHADHAHHEEGAIEISTDQSRTLGIQIRQASPGELLQTLTARGKVILHPDKLAHVLPKVSGIALEAKKNIGDPVKQGEVIAVLESREIVESKTNYLAALEKEKLALSVLNTEQRLREKKISAEQDFVSAHSSFEEAKINVELAKQKLAALGIPDDQIDRLNEDDMPNLRVFEIHSPFDGTVIHRHITKGEYIENTSVIYEIADLSKVWIEIGIYPKDLSKIKVGQTVQISSTNDPQQQGEAVIFYVSPIVGEETINAKAVAEIDNTQGIWRPGSFVTVSIDTDKMNAPIMIPKEAIQEIEGKKFVFVKIPEGYDAREVILGQSDKDNVEVLSGLRPGESYAATRTFLLKAELGKSEAEHTH